jgi:short-subunit dehydrogenase
VKRVLLIGATSAIAEAVARRYAARGDALYLTGRNRARLEAIAADLKVRGAATVGYESLDVNDLAAHGPLLERAVAALGGLDVLLIAHGTLPEQQACEASVTATLAEIATNGVSVIGLLTLVAPRFAAAGAGTLAVISSVAGDRGRASNYVYGSAKALVSTYLSGLRQRLYTRGVRVVTIKPGFVSTPMTAAFPKGPLWATPAGIAPAILAAIDRGTPVVYVPGFWRLIMAIVCAVPETVFQRLKM